MSENTKIEWCDATFNPWQGCEKVSPACKNCYAEAIVKRFGNDFAKRRRTSEENWKAPLKWDRWCRNNGVRKRVFSLSMGDWLDDQVPIEWLVNFLEVIRLTPNLDWLLLTKRPENFYKRMREAFSAVKFPTELADWIFDWAANREPRPNVWIGTTVEDQPRDHRIEDLLKIPARVRFLSCEPLLGPLDLAGERLVHLDTPFAHPGRHEWPMINWVICGGESGRGARPMHPGWARSLRDQCAAAGVPFFFKQWGEWGPQFSADGQPLTYTIGGKEHVFPGPPDGPDPFSAVLNVGKKAAGRLLDGREWNEFPDPDKPIQKR